jgi:hypothetical protein
MTHCSICFLTIVLAFSLSGLAQSASDPAARTSPHSYASPSGNLRAIVVSVGKLKGYESYESRIELRDKSGKLLGSHDFSSEDGTHGYGVTQARWTPDDQFFVFVMSSSGGHSPMFAPVVFWSRVDKHFYELKDYTASQRFEVSAPDTLSVSTWPGMRDATFALHTLEKSQSTELK